MRLPFTDRMLHPRRKLLTGGYSVHETDGIFDLLGPLLIEIYSIPG